MSLDRLVVGLVPEGRLRARDPRTRTFLRALEARIGAYVVERNVASYEELERDMTLARVDVAWLPPMLYARLERDSVASAIVTRAEAQRTYWSALVTSAGSAVRDLGQIANTRVVWVDPLSSAGYLVARLGLRARGIEPRTIFRRESFAGSHAAAVDAVLVGQADVAATFVHVDAEGRVVRGPWDEMGVPAEHIRVLALLGAIPRDVIAARTSVPQPVREAVAKAVFEMAEDPELGPVVSAVFGTRSFERGASEGYVELRELLERAARSGPHSAANALGSTSPPSKKPER
jgi:phosphate/phosphite/phosphonate ABC transporter binding protein